MIAYIWLLILFEGYGDEYIYSEDSDYYDTSDYLSNSHKQFMAQV